MAKKLILMKLLQEFRGYEQVTNRRPAPRPPALYLMQLRERRAQAQAPKRQRVAITADWQQNTADVALPVRINHLKAGHCELPVVVG
jgi:hypothetical protein